MARAREDQGERRRLLPWSRALLLIAVMGPALALGGVKPLTVPVFAVVVFGLLLRRCLRSEESLRVPALWWLGLGLSALTAIQCVPLPSAVYELAAPGLAEATQAALVDTGQGWSRISVQPGQTALECARLLALTGLFVAAAQLSWRLVAAHVSAAGTAVALIGLVQKVAGAEAIYGLYTPRQAVFGLGQELGSPLLTSFVNANHQSGLLLLGLFAAAAMGLDLRRRAQESLDPRSRDRLSDRATLAWGCVAIQATALVLSMSRGALISAALVTPVALWFAGAAGLGRASAAGSSARRQGRRQAAILVPVGLAMLGMLALALKQGASEQLASLRDPSSFADKLRVAREGLALVPRSPVLGTGRGSFVDLFPLVDSRPGPVLFTHLESTPVAWIVEWGPLAGGGALIAIVWWGLASLRAASPGARVVLCGLAALAVQSCADFSLDFLGVAAPAVALAGALGPSARSKAKSKSSPGWSTRTTAIVAGLGALVAVALSLVARPGTWSERRPRDRALLDRALDPEHDGAVRDDATRALASTPLDPFVHLALARAALAEGDDAQALTRAQVAARLRPASVDAHLVAAVAAARLDRPLASIDALRAALEQVREPAPEALIDYLIASMPEPGSLAQVLPEGEDAWRAVAKGLRARSPAHARALTQARLRAHPDDADAHMLTAELALDGDNPALALHHTRLLLAADPELARAHHLRARARFALVERAEGERAKAQLARAVDELEAALDAGLDDPGLVEETLVLALLRVGDEAAMDRAGRILEDLLARRADPTTRKRRQDLADRVRGQTPSRQR